jgi:heme-degrading monooxygenase HmoA
MADRVQHVVLFNFPQDLSAQEEQEMERHIRVWPDTIRGLIGLRFGKDVGGRSKGYDYLLLTEFENEEAHQAYYSHHSHVDFSEWVAAHGAELIRVDYPLDEQSLLL